jgi:hypothetical protein
LEEVDAQKPLFDYGGKSNKPLRYDDNSLTRRTVDSLKAVEIRNMVLKNMQSEISVFELLSAMPLGEVATKIATKSALIKTGISEES